MGKGLTVKGQRRESWWVGGGAVDMFYALTEMVIT